MMGKTIVFYGGTLFSIFFQTMYIHSLLPFIFLNKNYLCSVDIFLFYFLGSNFCVHLLFLSNIPVHYPGCQFWQCPVLSPIRIITFASATQKNMKDEIMVNYINVQKREKRNFVKAKEMIFNVKPGATPKEPKYLTLNRTVGLSFL